MQLIEAELSEQIIDCCIDDIHLATARSYLKATGRQLALVVNFAKPVLEIKRVVLTT